MGMSPALAVFVEHLDDAEVGEMKFRHRAELAARGWPAEGATHGVVAWRLVLVSLAARGGYGEASAVADAASVLPAAVWLAARARWRMRSARQRALMPEFMRARAAAKAWDETCVALVARLAVLGNALTSSVDEMMVQAAVACGTMTAAGVKLKK